ncbi:addiction module protein [Rhodopirellula islandica]|uniref:addiction module protein n=1 Tax=Rhodopirellula islandica TaxID=595434 RepID=UPI00064A7DD9|nr:addiction module protein [Rhodopirellula islandica]
MNVDQAISDLSTLPVGDRLRVVHAIWDTLPDDVDLSPSAEQQAEIDRRLAAHDADPSTAISHDEMMRRIAKRR